MDASLKCPLHGFTAPCAACMTTAEEPQLGPELIRTQAERDTLLQALAHVTAERDRLAERNAAITKAVQSPGPNLRAELLALVDPRAPLAFEAQCAAMRKAIMNQLQNSEHMKSVMSNMMGLDMTQGPLEDEALVLRRALEGTAGVDFLASIDYLRASLEDLLRSADASSADQGLGHDWAQACERARMALADASV
jgi:hypothetical protein